MKRVEFAGTADGRVLIELWNGGALLAQGSYPALPFSGVAVDLWDSAQFYWDLVQELIDSQGERT